LTDRLAADPVVGREAGLGGKTAAQLALGEAAARRRAVARSARTPHLEPTGTRPTRARSMPESLDGGPRLDRSAAHPLRGLRPALGGAGDPPRPPGRPPGGDRLRR